MTTVNRARRAFTGDRATQDEPVAVHTVEQLSPNMSRLPNGSLLCRNVPLARAGWMMYGPNETPIEVGDRGVAHVERTRDSLFEDSCLTSFVGAPVVDDHPADDVTPANWKNLAKGVVLTARQGTGDDADVILGDLLINDDKLIESVLSGKREVSAGYDADYEQTGDGTGRQTGIIINHVALVMKGRCGPRCAIGDQEFSVENQPKKELPMATKRVRINTVQRRAVLDGLRAGVKDAEAELAAAEEQMVDEGGDTHIHIHGSGGPGDDEKVKTEDDPYEARFAAIEGQLSEIGKFLAGMTKPADTKDEDMTDEEKAAAAEKAKTADEGKEDDLPVGKTKDSAALQTGYAQVLAKAEVLVPGFRMPTFDAALTRRATVDNMCKSRRKALDLAFATKDGAMLIEGIIGAPGQSMESMTCAEVAVVFNAAAGAKALINNHPTRDQSIESKQPINEPLAISIAAMNKANAEFWTKQLAKA